MTAEQDAPTLSKDPLFTAETAKIAEQYLVFSAVFALSAVKQQVF